MTHNPIRVTVWGESAENCSKYLAKGRSVYVEGRLQTRSYDKDGQKHYATDVVADRVVFLGGGAGAVGAASGPGEGSGPRRGPGGPSSGAGPGRPSFGGGDGPMSDEPEMGGGPPASDDDIPF